MDYIKIRSGEAMDAPEKGDPRSFEEMYQSVSPMFCVAKSVWSPLVDISETQTHILIQATLAGVEEDEVQVGVSLNAVWIRGHRRELKSDANRTYLQAEIRFGNFERKIHLPCHVESDSMEACFENGILTLTLSKISAPDSS
ncbi:MAG: Hsp20/alpha crystallin family protein [Desulfobacterales bacterium]|nr:Hsp20/alpha crystallin family protein [Desulfobacterales bacterium]